MKEKILVVDDEKIARVTLSQILRLEGYTVHSVESGEMALEALRQEPFDLVIVDLQMPGISGLDVLRNTVREFPGVRFIILTAWHHGYSHRGIAESRLRLSLKACITSANS